MEFNFKKALEYAQTPEGKAEFVLRKIVDTIGINEIQSLRFHTFSTIVETRNISASTNLCVSFKNAIGVWHQVLRFRIDKKDAISILKRIEEKLTKEGLSCIHEETGFKIDL